MTIRLSLLGAPAVERDGRAVSFDTRKAVALLAYLAVTGRPHRRESLALLGWPEVDRERAGAALRRTLSTIRTSAGADLLAIDGDTVALGDAVTWVDLRAARAAAAETQAHGHARADACARCVAPLQRAVASHRGTFLEGFSLRDSPEFDEWSLRTAEELQRELAETLSLLAVAHVAAGAPGDAIDTARRRLDIDPLHEPTHRLLMRLYAVDGDRAAALRQYRDCVRVLETDLGVTPLDETTALYEAIVAGRMTDVAVPGVAPPDAPGPGAAGPDGGPSGAGASGHRPSDIGASGDRPSPWVVSAPAPASVTVPAGVASGRPRARRLLPPGAIAAVPGGPSGTASGTASGTPFVARDAELDRLVAAIVGMPTDRGTLLVVEGEAGIGKTRLLDELCGRPVVRDRPVLRVTCQEDEAGLALGTVMEALRTAATGTGGVTAWPSALTPHAVREVARVLPDLAGVDPPPATDPGAAWRLRDALATALAATVTGGDAPGLLLIDDAHWMDEPSLDVVAHLVHRLERHPLCVVLAWRSELVGADHRLQRLLVALERRDEARSVSLDRLSATAVRGLLSATLAVEDDPLDTLADRVMATTEGVPLLVVEYVAALQVDPAALDGPPPSGAADLFRARLAAVGETARQILTTAAVIGRSFDPDLVRRVSGRAEDEAVDALEELVAAGLIRELAGDPPSYDFTHARLRALTYDDAGLARRRLLHRRVATALERRYAAGRRTVSAAAIAAHHRAAGDADRAAPWFARAARRATELLAVSDAVELYDAALALGHPEPGPIHEALGDLHTLAGRYVTALHHLEAAAALAADDRHPAIEHRIAGVHVRRGQWVLALQHLTIAQAALEGDDSTAAAALRSRILADRGLVAHREGEDDDAEVFAREALAAADTADDLAASAAAHNLLGVLSKGDLSRARHHLEHALALARRLHDVATEVAAANNLAQAHAAAGALDRALPIAEAALDRADLLGDRHRRAALHNNLADLLQASGRTEEAMTHLKHAVALFADVDELDQPQAEVWKLAEW